MSAPNTTRWIGIGLLILIISMFEDDDSVFAALQAGARGYLMKAP